MSDPTLPPEQPEQPPVPPAAPAGDYGPPAAAPPPPPAAPPPPAYGAPQAPPPSYAAPPPGYAAPAAPAYGGPMAAVPGNLAEWPARAIGGLIDYFAPFAVAIFIEFVISFTLGSLLSLVALGWVIYNKYIEGTTGQSYGKKIAGTKLVSARDGQIVGPGNAIVRWICHIVDGIPCYVGYLWPIWDAKKQTFADKIMNTYVITV